MPGNRLFFRCDDEVADVEGTSDDLASSGSQSRIVLILFAVERRRSADKKVNT